MKVTFIAIDKEKNESDWVLDAQQIGISTSIQDSKTGLTLTNIKFEEASVPAETLVMPKIAEERFYFDGTQITGYYGIRDKKNEDNLIWIDCPNNYLPVIVKALNSNFSA